MGDDVQEDSEKPKHAQPADKAGWVRKSTGGLLGLWKDRYILLSKAQLLVYESEDDQKCVEIVELGSYEACQDLRSLLKKKNRFILIRSPGIKVQDIKFQAKSPEEKEGWIKALNEGINRGKNRVFDQVTVDKSLALEHVTRDRVKVSHGRRPPTRIHLKEVASTASDGIMRLDLDVVDTGAPNFANQIADDLPVKEAPKPLMPPGKPEDSPALETSHLGNGSIADVHPQAPAPPSKALKEKAWKDRLGSKEEDDEDSAELSKENLSEENPKNSNEVPVPPPKISSDKLRAKLEDLSSEPDLIEDPKALRTSRENLADTAAKDAGRPPAPPPKILSEKLKIQASEVQPSQSNLETTDQDLNAKVVATEGETKDQSKEITSLREETEEGNDKEVDSASKEKQDLSAAEDNDKEETSIACKETENFSVSVATSSVLPKPRSSSVGNFLSECSDTKEGNGGQLVHLRKHHLHQMEMKLASGQEKAELLLQKVLDKGLVQAQDGKGSEAAAGVLLREAVQELRQASEALQEMKSLGGVEEKPGEEQKGLVLLYRKSFP